MENIILQAVVIALTCCISGTFCNQSNLDGGATNDRECMAALLDRVIQIEARDKQYENNIQLLQNTIHEQARRITVLEGVVQDLTFVKDQVGDDVKLKSGGYTLEKINEHHQTEVSKVSTGNGTILQSRHKRDTTRARRQQPTAVAFYASIDNHHLQHLGANQDITFDKVYTNVGDAYHVNLGVFIAPFPGTYVFSTTVMDVNSHDARYYFSVNGAALGNLFIHGLSSYLASTSRTATFLLKKGDTVSVRNAQVNEGIYGYEYSSFTGFMLSFDDSAGAIVG